MNVSFRLIADISAIAHNGPMSPWVIFLVFLGPLAVFVSWVGYAQFTGKFRDPQPEADEPHFGQRHPVLTILAIVFVLGFVSGMFIDPADNILLSGLISGTGGAALFLLLTTVPALILTVVQSVKYATQEARARPADVGIDEDQSRKPFHQRFVDNLEKAMDFLSQGWTP